MIALFLIGFALMAILSGALSYSISTFELFGVALFGYAIYKVIIENKKVLFWFSITLLTSMGVGSYYLYKIERIEEIYQNVVNFLLPFYYSVKVETYYIGRLHQFIMMIMISIIIYVFFSNVYYIKKIRVFTPVIGLVAIIIAFMIGTFSGTTDKQAFFIYIITTFIYYYEIYFITLEDISVRKQRSSFYVLACTMASVVIVFGLIGNSFFYNPFERKVRVVTEDAQKLVGENDLSDLPEIKELVYELPKDFTVQSNFTHQGIELFKIKSSTLKYFKVQTFDEFSDGVWIDQQKKYISQKEWPIEPLLKELMNGSMLDPQSFVEEEITVEYRNVVTNSLLVAPYTKNIIFGEDNNNIGLNVEEDGAVITDEMLRKGFAYSLQVVIPKYGTAALSNYLKDLTLANGNDSLQNDGLGDFEKMPDGYEDIVALSNQITQGLTSDVEKAQAIQDYLRTEYQYSEKPGFDENRDIIEQFLFENKVGFCQQFATSMVLLLRAQKIPSRFVVGYVAPEVIDDVDSIPEEILYRNEVPRDPYKHVYDSNAHAWVEVFYPSFGWIQFEPTPSQNLVQFNDPIDTNIELSQQQQEAQMSYQTRKKVALWVFVFVGIAVLVFAIIKFARYYISRRKDKFLRFVRTYKSVLIYLEAIKLGKEDSQTLREYSVFLERKLINSQLRLRDFLAILENAFYNQVEPSQEDVEKFEIFLQEIRFHVKRNVQGHVYNRLRFYEFILVIK